MSPLGEMKHAELLIDRIIFLEGTPEIARYDVIRVGTNIPEQLKNDLELETKGVHAYNDAVALCLRENDGGSRELLEKFWSSQKNTSTGSNRSWI